MSYDDWKTHDPADDCCEFCGVGPRELRSGWQPDRCDGSCRRTWRDPDYEYDQMRDDRT